MVTEKVGTEESSIRAKKFVKVQWRIFIWVNHRAWDGQY
ncbi:hypothetical protein D082_06280 [Synechocystis sp. PCC 6714]|nr:hypothetical protein D082_06280 [Synechocystis sp. PCC 6714]